MEKVVVNAERYRGPIRNWWVSILLGVVFLAMGTITFFYPGEAYFALSVLFGIGVLVAGILEIYLGVNMLPQSGRGWVIAMGIIEVLLGVLLVFLPDVSRSMLPFVLGFWLLFRGFSLIGLSSDMMAWGIKGPGWVLALAILLIICSFIILFNPLIGIGTIVIWLGVSMIILGVAMIVLAIDLYRLRKMLSK